MPQETPLISTIVAALVLAFILGAIANRLKLPPLVGYLLAGVVVGPYSPGFVADQELANQLSEIGVILLMFGVGLNFSLRDLMSVQAVAIPGSLGRIGGATLMGLALAWLMGWPLFGGIIFGLALSVASTVVLLKTLHDRHLLDSERGRIAVGWVIVEDIAMVLALVLIPAFATVSGGAQAMISDPFVSFTERLFQTHLGLWGVIAVTVVKLAAFAGFMLVVGRRLIPLILHFTAHTGSRELFRLAVLAIALGVAAGSAYLFGVSLALGAFFAGMILSESELSQRAAQETLPLRDAFAVLFFVAVGMLFDPMIFVRSPLAILGVLFIVLFGKTAVAFLLMTLFRRPVGTALTVSAGLAQIGEFSFILAGLGVGLGVLPPEGQSLILAGAIVSILVNPLMFWLAEQVRPRLEARLAEVRVEPALGEAIPEPGAPVLAPAPAPADEAAPEPTTLRHHAVLIGYGRVGSVIGEGLRKEGRPFVLIEDAEGPVAAARRHGIEVIEGNAATSQALTLANVKAADTVIIAIPNAFEAGQATEQSRKLNPDARIIARAHSDEEVEHLKGLGADSVIMGEREIGNGMLDILRGEPPRPEATAAQLELALDRALFQPPADERPVGKVGPEEAASIEEALGRALDLAPGPAQKAPAGTGADIGPAAPAEPQRPLTREEAWLLEPAVERTEELKHADNLPEDEPVRATAGLPPGTWDMPPTPPPEEPAKPGPPAEPGPPQPPAPDQPPPPTPEEPPGPDEPPTPPGPAEPEPSRPPQETPPAAPPEDPWADPTPEVPVPSPGPAEPAAPQEFPPGAPPLEIPDAGPEEIPAKP